MSDFGDFNTPSEDPTTDFLARERAALGEDADLFSTNNNDLVSPTNDLTSPIPATSNPMSPALLDDFPAIDDGHASALSFQSPTSNKPDQDLMGGGNTSFETDYPKAEELETSQVRHFVHTRKYL